MIRDSDISAGTNVDQWNSRIQKSQSRIQDPESRAIAALTGNFRKVAAVRFFFWMHFFASIIVPFFRDWGRLSFTMILVVQAWFMFWTFLLEVPTGAVADRFGRRVSVALAGVFVAIASPVYASVPLLPVFLTGEVLFAAALTLISGADEALVYDSLKALGRETEATQVLSTLEAWKLAAIVVGALAGSVLAGFAGLRVPMFLQVVPALTASAIALTIVEHPAAARSGATLPRVSYWSLISGGIEHLWRHPVLRRLTLDSVSAGTVCWLIVWCFPPQLERAKIPIAAFGAVQSAMCVGQIIVLARQQRIARAFGGLAPLLRVTALLPAVGFFWLASTSSPVASIAGILVVSVPGLARGPLFSGALNRHISSEQRATVLSAISATRTLAIGLIYPVAGMLMDKSLPLALAVFGGAALVAAVAGAAPRRALE